MPREKSRINPPVQKPSTRSAPNLGDERNQDPSPVVAADLRVDELIEQIKALATIVQTLQQPAIHPPPPSPSSPSSVHRPLSPSSPPLLLLRPFSFFAPSPSSSSPPPLLLLRFTPLLAYLLLLLLPPSPFFAAPPSFFGPPSPPPPAPGPSPIGRPPLLLLLRRDPAMTFPPRELDDGDLLPVNLLHLCHGPLFAGRRVARGPKDGQRAARGVPSMDGGGIIGGGERAEGKRKEK